VFKKASIAYPAQILAKESRRHAMESNKSEEMLLERGFMPEQIERLRQLRYVYMGRELVQITKERRRLEFARWLVCTGRLTDRFPETSTL
jgi:hypothetical protein